MGSSASKASRTAATAARQYPTRSPTSTAPINAHPSPAPPSASQVPPPPGPTVKPTPTARTTRDEAINLDASDPDFAQSLRRLGPVQPNPTLSPTSAFTHHPPPPHGRAAGPDPRQNPALQVLRARAQLQGEAEREFREAGRRGHEGRQFLDVTTIRQVLMQRDRAGKSADEIERGLGLRRGVVARLGPKGVVGLPSEMGRAEREVEIV